MKASYIDNSNNNKEEKKSSSQKDILFYKFNKKLEEYITTRDLFTEKKNINYKEPLNNNKKEMNNLSINEINQNLNNKDNTSLLNNINLKEKNKNIIDENKLREASRRINFEQFMESDKFAENFYPIPSICSEYNNSINKIPYGEPFYDNKLFQDESLFFAFDNDYNNKYISKDDIRKIKKEDIKLSFGIDPNEIYGQLAQSKTYDNDKILNDIRKQLYTFNKFRSVDPNFNICMTNLNNTENVDNYNNLYNNNNCDNNEQGVNIENNLSSSQNSTRQNSKYNIKYNHNAPSLTVKETNFLFNTDKNDMKKNEDIKEKRIDKVNDNKFIKKKRKFKKN